MDEFKELHTIVAKLRSPNGCPWDREQTHQSLKPYLVEEVYEVLEAIDSGDPAQIKDELGDLLLQIALHAQIGEESGQFDLNEVAKLIKEKMIRRHPHVFAETKVDGVKDVWRNWEQIKKSEKDNATKSILDSVPASLPSLFRAAKIQKKAARVGFDWTEAKSVLDKIKEEITEFEQTNNKIEQLDEFGDILFSLVNLARKMDIDAEDALRLATNKFAKRFRYIEDQVRLAKKEFKDFSLPELEQFWVDAKATGL